MFDWVVRGNLGETLWVHGFVALMTAGVFVTDNPIGIRVGIPAFMVVVLLLFWLGNLRSWKQKRKFIGT